jgi:hypothetical protein
LSYGRSLGRHQPIHFRKLSSFPDMAQTLYGFSR